MKEKYIKSEVYELKKNIEFTEDFFLKKTFRICTEKLVAQKKKLKKYVITG